MEIKNHFGVYGVCLQEGKLLCIEKTRGPYQNRFDLPGGGQELGEGLTETLEREVLEETGYTLSRYSNPRIYDVMVQEGGQDFAVHQCLTLSVEGEGRVSWISRIRTDKLYKLEDKRRITNETSRNVEYL